MSLMAALRTRVEVLAVALLALFPAHGSRAACTEAAQSANAEDPAAKARARMVEQQIAGEIRDPRVLEAMRTIPRHRFVPPEQVPRAYDDRPLAIGFNQTISQPYIVALMTELIRPQSTDRVLEVGTGSGYQAAVLAELVQHVYTIEIVPELARTAQARLRDLGCNNVTVRTGDGYAGWPEEAPFDAIVVTAAPEEVPEPLIEQLKPGGRLVIPVGSRYGVQELQLIEKQSSGKLQKTTVAPVRFVPLVREPPA
jgi:protein-L-isoaspartate(D-aspartate) O-methyltransferase